MNDGDLLKPSIQLPKVTAPAPQHLKGRNKAITLLSRAMHYAPTLSREPSNMNTQISTKSSRLACLDLFVGVCISVFLFSFSRLKQQ